MVEIPGRMDKVQIFVERKDNHAFCFAIQTEGTRTIDMVIWLLKSDERRNIPWWWDKKTRVTFRRLVAQFIIYADHLYKRNPNGVHLRCLKEDQFLLIMDIIHGGKMRTPYEQTYTSPKNISIRIYTTGPLCSMIAMPMWKGATYIKSTLNHKNFHQRSYTPW